MVELEKALKENDFCRDSPLLAYNPDYREEVIIN